MIQITTAEIDSIGKENYKEIADGLFLRDDGVILIADGKEAVTVTIQKE